MVSHSHTISLKPQQSGMEVLCALGDMARSAVEDLTGAYGGRARVGRLRGSGPGVSFSQQIGLLERDDPRELAFPFEGSERVGGAFWPIPGAADQDEAVAKLRWLESAVDLPMHAHEHADRCIVVLDGRGFFHCSGQPLEEFDGTSVNTVAARQHDVFVFTRGVVHTFSTGKSPMTLISVQLPFLRFDDPRQYTIPGARWTAQDNLCGASAITVGGWQKLVG